MFLIISFALGYFGSIKKHDFAIIPDYSHSYKMGVLYLIVN